MVNEGLITGVKLQDKPATPCKPYLLAKAKRKLIPTSQTGEQATKLGELIYSDVWGPAMTQTIGHAEYLLGSAILPPSRVPKQNPMFLYVVLLYAFLCFRPVSALHPDLSPLYCTSQYFTSFTSVHLSISHPSPVPPIFLSVRLDYSQTPPRLVFHPIYPCSS